MLRVQRGIVSTLHPLISRRAYKRDPTGLEDTIHFAQRLFVFSATQLLQHIEACDHIEGRIRKR